MTDTPRFGRANPCCVRRAAASPDAMVCGECGSPILRCIAYKECGGLLDESGLCDVCVSPALLLESGARSDGKAGGALVLPLTFRNDSLIRRPLRVDEVWVGEAGGELRKQRIDWEELKAGEAKSLWVQTGELKRQGAQLFEITFTVASHYGRRHEAFAFKAALELRVDAGGGVVINQTINAGGDNRTGAGDAFLINIDTGASGDQQDARTRASQLNLVHADRFEKEQGVRGYKEGQLAGARVVRNARVTFKGFGKGEAPDPKPINTPDSLIVLGRHLFRSNGGETDVRLLIHDAQGAVDEPVSREISRRHIELFLQNGRLCMNVAGGAGVMLNNDKLPQDTIEILKTGDIIKVLPGRPDAIALQVRMRADGGEVREITLTRIPAIAGGG